MFKDVIMVITVVLFFIVLAFACCLMVAELKRDLMMMQQNSYRIERYNRWLKTSGDTTSMMRLLGMCVFLASLVSFARPALSMVLIGIFAVCGFISLSRRKYKKPLVWTARCKRIFGVCMVLCVIVVGVTVVFGAHDELSRLFVASVACVGLYVGSHIIMIAAVWVLKPVEKCINNRYIADAKRILASMPSLKVIGVTGSYGKTSTKHYLQRILSEKYETLMTPGSFNTTLGVVRTVREYLKPYTEVFICEMGAKQPNDVKEICDIVHPEIGVVTAVGPQHLESFKTIERVQQTKFELIDALPSDGLAVLNYDFQYVANREVEGVAVESYAVSAEGDVKYRAEDVCYTASGTTFTVVCPDGRRIPLRTKLVGECNISNLLAAVIVALHLEVPESKIAYAVEKIEQVEHRLNVKRTPGGITIIDDAFNSNPTGSAMALDVLGAMTSGKRIVITPGMIELGDRQEELNREFGRKIAHSADIAIIVGLYNRDAIVGGIEAEEGSCAEVIKVDSFAEAQKRLALLAEPGSTVLYENDLPDTFK